MRAMTDHYDEFQEEWEPAPPPGVRLGGTDIMRGVLVIVGAIVIGAVIFFQGIDDSDSAGQAVGAGGDQVETASVDDVDRDAAGAGADDGADPGGALADGEPADGGLAGGGAATDTSTPATAAAPETSVPSTTTSQPPLTTARPAAEVRVLVLNGGGPQGIAAKATEMLQASSYVTAAPKNADNTGPSAIYHIEGYEAEAVAVAAVFGAGMETLIQPIGSANPSPGDTQDAAVIVIVGDDNVIPVA